jgi:hypothetical protein
MEVVVPWQELIDLIELHYPKTTNKGCRPPYPLATLIAAPRSSKNKSLKYQSDDPEMSQ